jgi:hypothetical protein
LIPYNINVQYKWNQNLVDNNRFLANNQSTTSSNAKNRLDSYQAEDLTEETIVQRELPVWYKSKYYPETGIRRISVSKELLCRN